MRGLSVSHFKNQNSFAYDDSSYDNKPSWWHDLHASAVQLFPAPPLLPPRNHPHSQSLPHPTPLDGQQVTTTKISPHPPTLIFTSTNYLITHAYMCAMPFHAAVQTISLSIGRSGQWGCQWRTWPGRHRRHTRCVRRQGRLCVLSTPTMLPRCLHLVDWYLVLAIGTHVVQTIWPSARV